MIDERQNISRGSYENSDGGVLKWTVPVVSG